jgi:hypothetical protein
LTYFYGWPAPFEIPKRTSANIHASLKLVYLHRKTCPFWNSKVDLFSWETYPFQISKKNVSKRSYFPEIDLFSRVTYPFWNSKNDLFSRAICSFQIQKRTLASVLASLKLVYFHRQPAHFEIQKFANFHGRPVLFKFQKEL